MIIPPQPLGTLVSGQDMLIIFGVIFWLVIIFTTVRALRKQFGIRKQVPSPEERLKKLDQLKKGSLITDQEYDQQRKRIISEV